MLTLQELLNPVGIAAVITTLVALFKLKGKLSSLTVNIICIILGVILSIASNFALNDMSVGWIIAIVNGFIGGLGATGVYEIAKHIKE